MDIDFIINISLLHVYCSISKLSEIYYLHGKTFDFIFNIMLLVSSTPVRGQSSTGSGRVFCGRQQSKYVQRSHFHGKTVVFTKTFSVRHFFRKCPKERHSPPGALKFNTFSGGDCLSLGHLLRTWWTEKIA